MSEGVRDCTKFGNHCIRQTTTIAIGLTPGTRLKVKQYSHIAQGLYRQKFSVKHGKPRGGFLTFEARMEVLHKIGRSTVRPFVSPLV